MSHKLRMLTLTDDAKCSYFPKMGEESRVYIVSFHCLQCDKSLGSGITHHAGTAWKEALRVLLKHKQLACAI